MKKILIISTIIITLLVSIKEEKITIPNEAIRFRVVANSNSKEDQLLKKEIVNNLIPTIKETTNYDSIEDVRKSIKDNISLYTKIVDKTIKESNLNKTFHINYGKNHFPEKTYDNIIYEEGDYESLVITLGEAKGKNFWCILFPPLCLVEKDNTTNYKSYIKEIINKYF